jgi:N-methylhydantoinase A
MARLGIDVGGTFVDLVLQAGDGRVSTHKVLATPRDLVGGIETGVRELLEQAGVDGASVREVTHATTLGSNAVLERRGPAVALLTTAGFRDVLQIQRSLRWSMYDVQIEKRVPLVPRSLVWEIAERCLADGTVLAPLPEDDVAAAARELTERGVEAAAVAYLHSYAAPGHERRTREILAEEAPQIAVTISSDVSLQGREYERTNTAAVNAYLMPVLSSYLRALSEALPRLGISARLWIMQSSGGLAPAEQAVALPVRTIESGPAAGALMSAHHGRMAGYGDVISFDMGGTTAKAALIRDGRPATSRFFELERVELRRGSGLPIDIPAIDLVEIGAGGGSIAETRLGALTVGPRSAGADPGPACYGLGGDLPTVTDANLLLGYLYEEGFAGGAIRLGRAAAENAVDRLAGELGLDRTRAAWGVHEIVTLEMERAIHLVSIGRGFDPRDFALVAIGGAAPAHACRLARSIGIGRVLVPPAAGVGSALGLLEANESFELARTAIFRLDDGDAGARAAEIFASLEEEARTIVGDGWGSRDDLAVVRAAGLRYAGQGYELEVTMQAEPGDSRALVEAFQAQYERTYGYREEAPVEAVTWYLTLVRGGATTVAAEARGAESRRPEPLRVQQAYFPETDWVEVPVFDRARLVPGDALDGPALVTEAHTTTVVLPEARVAVDERRALVLEAGGGAAA